MNIGRYNYWLYATLTIFCCWIILNISNSNYIMLSFYLLSCFYLSLYFLIKILVKYRINRKYKTQIDNVDCNINECNKVECKNLSDKKCKKQKYCIKNTICKRDSDKCEELKEIKNDITHTINNKINSKLEKLSYYKIRGKNFKKHINHYLIILLITFFIYIFIIILMKSN